LYKLATTNTGDGGVNGSNYSYHERGNRQAPTTTQLVWQLTQHMSVQPWRQVNYNTTATVQSLSGMSIMTVMRRCRHCRRQSF